MPAGRGVDHRPDPARGATLIRVDAQAQDSMNAGRVPLPGRGVDHRPDLARGAIFIGVEAAAGPPAGGLMQVSEARASADSTARRKTPAEASTAE